jgi:hypothetical protein
MVDPALFTHENLITPPLGAVMSYLALSIHVPVGTNRSSPHILIDCITTPSWREGASNMATLIQTTLKKALEFLSRGWKQFTRRFLWSD